MASTLCFPANSAVIRNRNSVPQLNLRQCWRIRCSLDSDVSDMSTNAPKGLFPPEPERYKGPKLKVAIIGSGLAGMSTAVELLDQGHEVDIYESRPFIGGKVGSFVDKKGNHIEMGLHVFFGCYNNLFRLLKKVGAEKNLLVKDHTHTFVNEGGEIGELDFRFPVGAPIHGIRAFLATNQLQTYDKARNALALALSPVVRALVDPDGAMQDIRNLDSISFSEWFLSKGGTRASIQRMWDPVAYALGFIDCDNISARCMLTIFSLFATKTEASLLRMLKGSPDVYLSGPIRKYIEEKGGRFHLRWGCRKILYDRSPNGETYVTGLAMSKATNKKTVRADAYVAACDVPGIKKLLPAEWRDMELFNNIYELVGVPVVTVQLRYNGWVTELRDLQQSRQLKQATGLDNLLYTPDADFSCFADLALTSPEDYYIAGQGSLLQCVLTPGDPYMPLLNEEIIKRVSEQVLKLFPSSRGLDVTWSSVVKIGQSLYREGPGKDPFRPDQKTPVNNFFLAGSYTKQDYIDSMEGATLSGRQAAAYICDAGEDLFALREKLPAIESKKNNPSILLHSFNKLRKTTYNMANSTVVKLACALVMCIVVAAPLAEAAITCGLVSSKVAPCIPYLKGGAAPTSGCCGGIKALNAAAASAADKKVACGCLKNAAAAISGIDYSKAAGLPGKCGVSIPYAISPSTNCNAIH